MNPHDIQLLIFPFLFLFIPVTPPHHKMFSSFHFHVFQSSFISKHSASTGQKVDNPANEIELAKSRCASSERRAVKREGKLETGSLWGVDGDADKDDDGGRGGREGPGGRRPS